jgi:hypothetical protein
MVCPFSTNPPDPAELERAGRYPFGEPPPPGVDKAALLNDPILWQQLLKQLGNSNDEDAAVIDQFAARLGIDRRRILAKMEAHFFDDNRALH